MVIDMHVRRRSEPELVGAIVNGPSAVLHAPSGRPVALHTATFMRSAVALHERCGFVRAPALDLAVTDILDVVADGALPVVLAYRLAPDALRRAGP